MRNRYGMAGGMTVSVRSIAAAVMALSTTAGLATAQSGQGGAGASTPVERTARTDGDGAKAPASPLDLSKQRNAGIADPYETPRVVPDWSTAAVREIAGMLSGTWSSAPIQATGGAGARPCRAANPVADG